MSPREVVHRRVHQAWVWWWATVDNGGVLCQTVLYPGLFLAGVYMSVAAAPQTVEQQMGDFVHWAWVVVLIVCPLTCFVGSLLRNQWTGRWLQLWSNVGITCSLGAYVSAVLQASWLGRGLFAVFIGLFLALLTGAICVRDVRKLREIRSHAKEM